LSTIPTRSLALPNCNFTGSLKSPGIFPIAEQMKNNGMKAEMINNMGEKTVGGFIDYQN
jgi:hypothetical protein